jgi:hypothetical protein
MPLSRASFLSPLLSAALSGDDVQINELLRIKALGNLLQYYHSDLTYILNFQMYKQNLILSSKYLLKSPGSFQSFLNEFRVARNVQKHKVAELLNLTTEWVRTNQADDVDEFADKLREENLTQKDKTMTSLASKILFLNNPWDILPCDSLNRRAVGVKTNRYSDFYSATRDTLERETSLSDDYLKPVQGYMRVIENEFKGEIDHISTIRRNRFIDKLLWVRGQK